MSYQPITWRNVNSRSDAAANALVGSAQQSLNRALTDAGKGLAGIQNDRQAEYDSLVNRNTQDFLDKVAGYTSVDQLQSDQANGLFERLQAGYNGAVDPTKIRQAVGQRISSLQDSTLQGFKFNEQVTDQKEAPFIGEIEKAISAFDFTLANEKLAKAPIRDEVKARLQTEINSQQKTAVSTALQKQLDAIYRSALDRKGNASDTSILRDTQAIALKTGANPTAITAMMNQLDQALVNSGQLASGDKKVLDEELAKYDNDPERKRIMSTDTYRLMNEVQELSPTEQTVKLAEKHGEKLEDMWFWNKSEAIESLNEVLSQGYNVKLDDGSGGEIRVPVSASLMDLVFTVAEPRFFSAFSDKEDIPKLIEEVIASTNLSNEVLDAHRLTEERKTVKEDLTRQLKGNAQEYRPTLNLPKPNQPQPNPNNNNNEEESPDEVNTPQTSDDVRPSFLNTPRAERDRIMQERLKREAEKEKDKAAEYDRNPEVIKARKAINQASNSYNRLIIKAQQKKRLEALGIPVEDL